MTQVDFNKYKTSGTDVNLGRIFKASCREVADKISKYDKKYRNSAGWKLNKDGQTVSTKSVTEGEENISFPCELLWADDSKIKDFCSNK